METNEAVETFLMNASLKQKTECAVKLQSTFRMFVIYRQNKDFLKKKKMESLRKKNTEFLSHGISTRQLPEYKKSNSFGSIALP